MEMIEYLGYYLKEGTKTKNSYGKFSCCICGNIFTSRIDHIKRGETKSCGCLRKTNAKRTHGLSRTPLYTVWCSIKKRCSTNKNKDSKNYYDRGILICDEWKYSFILFYEWCIKNGYKEWLEIDRIDNDGNYCPENCRWVTHLKNSNNKRLISSRNTSGYNGVSYHKQSKRWQSRVTYNNKVYYVGKFSSIEEAVVSRNNFIIKNGLPHKLTIID